MSSDLIDVRTIEPRERHPIIFGRLAELETGTSLRLLNDHDPKPLRYQLEAEQPDHFRWDYVEQGPERWAVDITKRAHVVDARPILDGGDEPFDAIMDAAEQVGDDQILVVWAPFEPIPLEGVLTEQGFSFAADEVSPGNWRVVFSKA